MTTTSHPLANPVIRGFAPDPSIIRVGTRYYVATSTFTWFPAIRLMMSDDLRTWSLAGHALDDQTALDLRELPANCGVFAPDLAYDPVLDRYTLAFSVVRSMVGDALDVEDWVLMAPHPAGPWSGLTYLGSIGIDPSIFYDDDGRAWLLALEWDPRAGYERPGAIVLEELDRHTLSPVGPTRRISRGGTDRGSVEGPHLYRHEGRYYLVTAEGGTGYGHCVAVARSTCIEGPYEADPRNPVLSAVPYRFYGRDRRDTWPCLEHYLPNAPLQKAGHASLVEAHTGQWFFAYLCSRPVDGAPVSSLGRETAVQEVTWTADGWLRLADGGREPQELTAGLDDRTYGPAPTTALIHDDFAGPAICPELMTPHQPLATLGASLNKRPGWMRLSGRRSLFSRADVALVAVRVSEPMAEATTAMDFTPNHFSQSAGLAVYYDEANWLLFRKYFSETLGCAALGVLEARAGQRIEYPLARRSAPAGVVHLRAQLDGIRLRFAWSLDGRTWEQVGDVLDASHLCDEQAGGFTGITVGITATDAYRRQSTADFDYFTILCTRQTKERS